MGISLGYFQQTVTTAAAMDLTQLSAAEQNILDYVLVIPETNGIRYRADGTNPTASVGVPVPASTAATNVMPLIYDDPAKILAGIFKMIAQSGTATVNLEFWSGTPRG